jgi:type I restriction enzyme S subunit
VPAGLAPFALQRSVAVLSPRPELLSKFLCYQLQSPAVQRYFEENARGTAQKGVYLKTLGMTPVVLPPVATQVAVVAQLEKQFSRLDEAVANLQRVKANLKRYKASVLKAAVEGRLVETEATRACRESRTYETGEQLLQRILDERRTKWIGKGKYKEPATLDTSPEVEPPEGWTWCNFEQVSSSERNALKAGPFGSALKKEFYVPVGYKIYGQEQVIAGDHTFGDYYISEEKYRELENCAVKPGDILVSLVGTTGKVLVLPLGAEPGIINPRLIKLSLNPQFVAAQYASYYLQSAAARSFFKLQAHGGTMEILNLGIVKALPVCLPPLAEQVRIVAEVDRHLSIIREVEAEVDANLQRAQALRQATLAKAFSGVGK